MDHNLTALERAFQIAKSGDVTSVKEVRRMLRKEGYQVEHIAGLSLSRQLSALMKPAKAARKAET